MTLGGEIASVQELLDVADDQFDLASSESNGGANFGIGVTSEHQLQNRSVEVDFVDEAARVNGREGPFSGERRRRIVALVCDGIPSPLESASDELHNLSTLRLDAARNVGTIAARESVKGDPSGLNPRTAANVLGLLAHEVDRCTPNQHTNPRAHFRWPVHGVQLLHRSKLVGMETGNHPRGDFVRRVFVGAQSTDWLIASELQKLRT